MKRNVFLAGILAMALVFGLTVISCNNETESQQVETNFSPVEFTSGLPVLKVNTDNRAITSTEVWYEGANYDLYNSTGNVLLSGVTDIKGRGHGSWAAPKKPYAIKFSAKQSILDMASHKRWNVLTNYTDKTLLRNELGFKVGDIFDNMAWIPSSRQIDFYLNDKYLGMYLITEAIKIDINRVNINEIKKSNASGGYILEIDNFYKSEEFGFTTSHGIYFSLADPDSDLDKVITGTEKTIIQKIQEDVQSAEDVLYADDWLNPETGYRTYFDAPSFIDWWICEEIIKDYEINFLNGRYIYYDDTAQKYCAGPLWDMDWCFGNTDSWYTFSHTPEGFITIGNPIGGRLAWWIDRLFEDPIFVMEVKTRWNQKKSELDTLNIYVTQRALELNTAQDYNFHKWAILTGTYSGEITYLKNWITQRIAWLDNAINRL